VKLANKRLKSLFAPDETAQNNQTCDLGFASKFKSVQQAETEATE